MEEMEPIIAVSTIYYDLTHRIVSQLKISGLERMSKATNIPLEDLKKFAKDKTLDPIYMPTLYFHLFGTMTFLEAQLSMDKDGW